MSQDYFTATFDGTIIESALIWECTRFCVENAEADAPGDVQRITAELLLGMCETGLSAGLSKIAGVFDGNALHAYQRSGWTPHILGEQGRSDTATFLGMWNVTDESAAAIRKASGLNHSVLEPSPDRA